MCAEGGPTFGSGCPFFSAGVPGQIGHLGRCRISVAICTIVIINKNKRTNCIVNNNKNKNKNKNRKRKNRTPADEARSIRARD